MQLLIAFSNPRAAQAFVDYMATQGVHIETRINHNHTELWLANPTQLTMVQRELDHFLTNPQDKRYSEASWQTENTTTSLTYRRENYLRIIKQKAGWLTLLVMTICIAVYSISLITSINNIMLWLAFPAGASQYDELWRWLTPVFIHFSLIHIGFNIVLWWYIGGPIEQRLGVAKLLQILFVSALISNYAQSLFSGNSFGGLSGVVYALVGYAWLTGERAPEKGIQLDRGLVAISILWLFIGYFDMLGTPIANAAHLFGLFVGLTLALWDTRSKSRHIKQ